MSLGLRRVARMHLNIDCRTCVRQQTATCDDCVVSFISSREPDEAVIVAAAEYAALRRLQAAGLVPGLRHHGGPGGAQVAFGA